MTRVFALFFVSGFPALIYQIVWQRALFTLYGVNIESVTVVVSAFMLGLGLGSLAGGWMSKKPGAPLLATFGVMELGIAAYGLVSLDVFRWVASFSAGASTLATGCIAFVLVVLPTAMMGATLPLLSAHLVRASGNVGRSVGILYCVNTLGSAVACFAAAKITMPVFGEAGSIRAAAALNVVVGVSVLLLARTQCAKPDAIAATEPVPSPGADWARLPAAAALSLSAMAGFIALSYELLWYRMYAFASTGLAKTFPYLLGAYLAGIAAGSVSVRRLCVRNGAAAARANLTSLWLLFTLANGAGFLVGPALAWGVGFMSFSRTIPVVALAAALLGATFPLVCHLSIKPDSRAGAGVSYLYVANIVGSTAGSLTTGFVMMDHWPLVRIAVILALAGIALGMVVLFAAGLPRPRLMGRAVVSVAVAASIVYAAGPLFDGIYERLQQYDAGARFVDIVENRSGVITVTADGTVYGGGSYDGRFNVGLLHDTNMILRLYAVGGFHPAPREVLQIGLASGSWAQVLAGHPQVKNLTIVEINPGYLHIIPKHPEVAGLLRNPKVSVIVDDGRRWLLAHPDRTFDLIVMNTTSHLREHVSNLLSVEFLRLVRKHLKPGGVHYYNTTSSEEAQMTGAAVFPFALRVHNFVAVSDAPLAMNEQRWRDALLAWRVNGRPVLDPSVPGERRRLDKILALLDGRASGAWLGIETGESLRRRCAGRRLITDDNMGLEWTP